MKKQSPERTVMLKKTIRSKVKWPRIYRIVVEGRLDASWSEVLAGMQITPGSGDRSSEPTVIIGSILDRSELSEIRGFRESACLSHAENYWMPLAEMRYRSHMKDIR